MSPLHFALTSSVGRVSSLALHATPTLLRNHSSKKHVRFGGGDVPSTLYRVVGDCHRGKELEFGDSVLAHLLEVGKGSGNLAPKLVDTRNLAVWLGKSDLADGHLVGTDDCIVCTRCARRTTLVRRELPRSRRDHRRRSRRRLLRLTLKVFLPQSSAPEGYVKETLQQEQPRDARDSTDSLPALTHWTNAEQCTTTLP